MGRHAETTVEDVRAYLRERPWSTPSQIARAMGCAQSTVARCLRAAPRVHSRRAAAYGAKGQPPLLYALAGETVLPPNVARVFAAGTLSLRVARKIEVLARRDDGVLISEIAGAGISRQMVHRVARKMAAAGIVKTTTVDGQLLIVS